MSDERGQALMFVVLFLTTLLGLTALVLDVGSWLRTDRALQATVDAAALAAAQALPDDPATAQQLATSYGDKNGGGVAAADVRVASATLPNDTISVHGRRSAPGFFSRVLGIFSVDIGADATARALNLGSARWVAPIAVSEQHALLQCRPQPCFDVPATIPLARPVGGDSDAPGAFGLINLSGTSGSPGASTLASWLRDGYDGVVKRGAYYSAPGADFNSTDFRAALAARVGDELLFPVYRSITGSGSNAVYDVVGWVGFTLTAYSGSGSTGALVGRFTRVTWDGAESTDPAQPAFGARVVELVR